jgi:hypothetical protein
MFEAYIASSQETYPAREHAFDFVILDMSVAAPSSQLAIEKLVGDGHGARRAGADRNEFSTPSSMIVHSCTLAR